MKPRPTENLSTPPPGRLRRAGEAMRRLARAVPEALRQAIPAADPPCCHGYGHAYCPDEECYNATAGGER